VGDKNRTNVTGTRDTMTLAQQDLVTAHVELVRKIAGRHAKRLPIWVEMDEILSAGYFGLCQAADRFDPSKHASFAVWASWRIHGAIMDAFEGPRYPRRYVEMPEPWYTDGQMVHDMDMRSDPLPEALIDRSSILDTLIEREQCVVVSIDAVRARRTLSRDEGAVIDRHIAGASLTCIATKRKMSRSQAHKFLVRAKAKMRAVLEGDKAA
jgi:RNA polymerase sigma factor (sigma-70 family)